MRLLQIDTINVVNRSPYLVLFARLGTFPLVWLEAALAQQEIFEVWAREACFAPIDNFAPLFASLKNKSHWAQKKRRMPCKRRAYKCVNYSPMLLATIR